MRNQRWGSQHLKVVQHLARRLITNLGIFFQRLENDFLDSWIDAGVEFAWRGHTPIQYGVDQQCAGLVKGQTTSAHLIKDQSGSVEIVARIERTIAQLLWRHISQRAG